MIDPSQGSLCQFQQKCFFIAVYVINGLEEFCDQFSYIAVERSIFMGVQTMVLDLMSSESCKNRIRNLVCLSCFQYVHFSDNSILGKI